MKTNRIFVTLLVAVLFLITSCEFFTHSLGEGFARDQAKLLAKSSASSILTASGSMSEKAILEALGTKSKEELKGLSKSDKETVLNITFDGSLNTSQIAPLADEFLNNQSGTSPEQGMQNLANQLVDLITPVNTSAAQELLNDQQTLETVAGNQLANAAFALLAQSAKELNNSSPPIDIMGNMGNQEPPLNLQTSTTQDIVDAMLDNPTSANENASDQLVTAINTLKVLSGAPIDLDGNGTTEVVPRPENEDITLFGALPLTDLLSQIGL
ncbi:MAG TPA: hypothetical protein VFC68_06450 [Treponemataceae bacterium]|nr:hypothetical protein [Treponemataceae bacterium]